MNNTVYVTVVTRSDTDGNVCPVHIQWHDGRGWDIEKILYTRSRRISAGTEIRYTVLIGGKEKYLFRLREKWYVQSPSVPD
jgi:hypothetical protein